jgi:2'-5' RNA ligase
MAVAVALCLDGGAAKLVQDMSGVLEARGISDYATHVGYRPHVTLIRGDDVATEPVQSVLRDFAAALSRIPLRLNAIAGPPGDRSVLWIALADNPSLREAPATPYRALAPLLAQGLYSSPRLWIPHVTLAEGLSEEERARARDALLPSFTPIEATGDRLELVRFPPTHVEWVRHYRMPA